MPSRRRCLLATAGLVGLPGCSGRASPSGESGTRIASIRAQNVHAEPHTIHVLVVEGGDPVLRETRRLDAAYEENGTLYATSAELPDVPADAGEYVVYAWVDDGEGTRVLDLSEGEYGSCVRLEPEVDRDGSFAVEYATACGESGWRRHVVKRV